MEPIRELALEGVGVSFGDAAALRDLTLSVEPGERVAVIGASGAGKSTLFRALTRSVALSGGTVTIGGRDLYALSKKRLRDLRRGIGTIHQSYNLVPQLPAGVNVALGEVGGMKSGRALRTFLAGPDAALAKRVRGALEEVELSEFAGTRTADLSGGQQQRVAVARLLVQRPEIILADEPFAAVDPVTTEKVLEALLTLNAAGATLLANMHDVDLARRFPRVVALREGGVYYDGPPDQLTDEKLAQIYRGDPRNEAKPAPEERQSVRHCMEDPMIRLTEGRDGVSAH